MSNSIKNYRRKSFPARAARVDPLNIKEIASWCGGQIREGEKEGHFSREFIKVRVMYPANDRQTEAHIGDWVVKTGKNYKVYTDKAFRKTFELPDGQEVDPTPIRQASPTPNSMPKQRAVEEAAQEAIANADPTPTEGAVDPAVQEGTPKGVELSDEQVKLTVVGTTEDLAQQVPNDTVRPGDEPSAGEKARGEI